MFPCCLMPCKVPEPLFCHGLGCWGMEMTDVSPSAAIPLPLSCCQVALWLQEMPECPSQCPGSAGWPHLQPHRSREVPGEGVQGSTGTSRGKRRDSGLSPQVACGKPWVTVEVTSSKALGKDLREAELVVRLWWAAELISPSAAAKVMLQSWHKPPPSKFSCKNAVKPQFNSIFFTTCKSSRYSHSTFHRTFSSLLYRMQGLP